MNPRLPIGVLFLWFAIPGLGSLLAGESPVPRIPVAALAFTPDSKLLVSSGRSEVAVRSIHSPEVISEHLPCIMTRITALNFADRAGLLAIAGGVPGVSGGFQLMNWSSRTFVASDHSRRDIVTSIGFSPDGSMLGVAGWDHAAEIWRRNIGDAGWHRERILTGHSGPLLGLVFSPDSSWIVTAGLDRSIKVWSAASGELMRTLSHHLERVNCLGVAGAVPGGDLVSFVCASGSEDHTVRVWQPGIGRMVRTIRSHDAAILSLVYSRDGSLLFTAGGDGVLRAFDASSDRLLFSRKGHQDLIHVIALSPDGETLASGDNLGMIKTWKISDIKSK